VGRMAARRIKEMSEVLMGAIADIKSRGIVQARVSCLGVGEWSGIIHL
jgi:hypothetical protein